MAEKPAPLQQVPSVAVVCSSNMNRSMEAHALLDKRGLGPVQSYCPLRSSVNGGPRLTRAPQCAFWSNFTIMKLFWC